MFTRQHFPKTLFVLLLIAVFLSLGMWQLDRRAEKRADNARIAAQLALEPLVLNEVTDRESLEGQIDRPIIAHGRFDFSQQVVLDGRTGPWGQGSHLVAPFLLDGTDRAILVDRGWVAMAELRSADRATFDEPFTTVTGLLKRSDRLPRNATGQEVPGDTLLTLPIPLLQNRMPYPLLPVWLLQSPAPGEDYTTRPWRAPQQLTLPEGNHIAYAVQWFTFAVIAGVGYVVWLRREARNTRPQR
jgi:surfeit locus 1 family protein